MLLREPQIEQRSDTDTFLTRILDFRPVEADPGRFDDDVDIRDRASDLLCAKSELDLTAKPIRRSPARAIVEQHQWQFRMDFAYEIDYRPALAPEPPYRDAPRG